MLRVNIFMFTWTDVSYISKLEYTYVSLFYFKYITINKTKYNM